MTFVIHMQTKVSSITESIAEIRFNNNSRGTISSVSSHTWTNIQALAHVSSELLIKFYNANEEKRIKNPSEAAEVETCRCLSSRGR